MEYQDFTLKIQVVLCIDCRLIKELTVGLTLPAKFKEAYPIEAKLIIDMTSANPKKRPTAE